MRVDPALITIARHVTEKPGARWFTFARCAYPALTPELAREYGYNWRRTAYQTITRGSVEAVAWS